MVIRTRWSACNLHGDGLGWIQRNVCSEITYFMAETLVVLTYLKQ